MKNRSFTPIILGIITILELFLTKSMENSKDLWIMYGIYKIFLS